MKCLIFFIFILLSFYSAFSQDTIHIYSNDVHVLSARQKLYFFMPVNNDRTDSVIVLNSKAYYSLIEDKQACVTFTHLYQLYKKRIGEGDAKVQQLIRGYDVIIQTKDSSYTTLLKQYDAERALTTKSIQQTTETLRLCRNSFDSLNTSLNRIQQENTILKQDIETMNKHHKTQKWSFAIAGCAIGLLVGILLTH